MNPKSVRSAVAVVAFLSACSIAAAGTATAAPTPVAMCGSEQLACHSVVTRESPLPKPTGSHIVGRVDVRIDDPARDRSVMVSAWYPAAEAGTPAPYIPATSPEVQAWMAFRSAEWLHSPASAAALIGAAAPAGESAPIAVWLGPRPVVLLSPGLGTPRWILSGLASDLASRGYIVVGMDHTGESPVVEMPDGQVVLGDPVTMTDDYMAQQLADRVADTRLTVDHLTDLPIVGGLVDEQRIVMAGHSFGGYTAVAAMHDDPRIKAGVVLDGPAAWHDNSAVERNGVQQPVLLIGYGDTVHASWIQFGANNSGPFAMASVRGGAHYAPTDLPSLGGPAELCGELTADRNSAITRELVSGWIDHVLNDTPMPATAEWPEVTWQRAS